MAETGFDGENAHNLFGAIDALRIPMEYLAELFTAGDLAPVRGSLRKLAAMRCYLRALNLGDPPDDAALQAAGLNDEDVHALYRLLAVAKYDERYVIPTAGIGDAHELESIATSCSLDTPGGPGMGGEPGTGGTDLVVWNGKQRPDSLFPTLRRDKES